MSNLGPLRTGSQPGVPTPARGATIARYRTYLEAQRAVDHLSDEHFPVQAVTIVGVDLQMVERVTGRLTYSRVAVAGLLSGAWFGLFVGLLLSLFGGNGAPAFSLIGAILIGAAFGMLFGIISYALTGGRRDFTSTSQIVAAEYRVLCLDEQAGQAQQLLRKLPGGSGFDEPPVAAAPATGATPAASGPAYGASSPDQPAQPEVPVSGPTYSEMIDRKRREEQEAARRGEAGPGAGGENT